ncbi:molybdopterin biosynthesis protein [Halanaerobium sp. MA284_MarDTE_T2]|uniref:molybdopterin biosynthesis protein n=1 Tax=Halanaerobium sp. MA284_MarDTE_T2 TaxID=2183913 RepID=UPI000DF32D59|nr:molybdopterin biosynthesis protein [Halanaerobium sp. MA284_MarDTE_T2]RCW51589.1 molybdopterin molybdochelatase [Halanaerobium sp. MA284_MarDTE_T2]
MKRNIYLKKSETKKSLQKWLAKFKNYKLDTEKIRVTEADGRVLSQAVYAERSAPNFYASAMDGIAVNAADSYGADERNPVTLKKDDFTWVDTGDPVPDKFNAVIKIEEINKIDSETVIIEKSISPWQNIRMVGESVIKDTLISPVNTQLKFYHIGAFLEAGVAKINVYKKLKIGIIPTGSELVDAEQTPQVGQLVDFNSQMIKVMAEKWGADVKISDIIPDREDKLNKIFDEYNEKYDLTVILSGSSAGSEDFSRKVIENKGEILTHGIDMMPGKPLILASVNKKPVIGLPGYPLSAIFTFYYFGQSIIKYICTKEKINIKFKNSITRRKFSSSVGNNELKRVLLRYEGNDLISIPGKSGAAAMDSLIKSDGIALIKSSKEGIEAGGNLPVILLKSEAQIKNSLLLAGSHDLTLDIIKNEFSSGHSGLDFKYITSGSMGGLTSLKRREAEIAGAHLLDTETGSYNESFVKKLFNNEEMVIVNLVKREQGLMVVKGNPNKISELEDIIKKDLNYINRQKGAGTRVLLDYILEQKNINKENLNGYKREVYTHIAAAAAVASGGADAALGIKAAADIMGLDFIPVKEERYDFVFRKNKINDIKIEKLLNLINSDKFKNKILKMDGYKTDITGEIKYL